MLVGVMGVVPPAALHADDAQQYPAGFTVDDTRVRRMTNLDAIHAATNAQIDIVYAVGLPPEMMAFFRGVKFEVVPPGVIAPGRPASIRPGPRRCR